MKSVKQYLNESKLNKEEKVAYNESLEAAKNALINGISSPSGKVDKAIQQELLDFEHYAGVDLTKVETEVYKVLKSSIKKIK